MRDIGGKTGAASSEARAGRLVQIAVQAADPDAEAGAIRQGIMFADTVDIVTTEIGGHAT